MLTKENLEKTIELRKSFWDKITVDEVFYLRTHGFIDVEKLKEYFLTDLLPSINHDPLVNFWITYGQLVNFWIEDCRVLERKTFQTDKNVKLFTFIVDLKNNNVLDKDIGDDIIKHVLDSRGFIIRDGKIVGEK